MTIVLRNPKDQQELTTELTQDQALSILKKNLANNNFAQDLVVKYPDLSASQWYWFFKLAHDNQRNTAYELKSNLQEFISKFGMLQFKVGRINISPNPEIEKLRELGKLKFYTKGDSILVVSGIGTVGEIKGSQFFPTRRCPEIIISQVIVFSIAPVEFLELFGKLTGVCCICGRLLTNEESVNRGIGPICAERYGV